MTRLTMVAPLVAVLALISIARDADAGARRSRPVKTGQVTCWDSAGSATTCVGSGQDGELLRGEPRAYIDNGNGTIKDNRTALTWEKLSNDGTIHDKDLVYTWDAAFTRIETLTTPPCFAGFCDWRLPNRFELETLVNLGNSDPAISSSFNTGCPTGCTVLTCSCTFPGTYASSSTFVKLSFSVWYVDFSDGNAFANQKTVDYHVRAVRGGS